MKVSKSGLKIEYHPDLKDPPPFVTVIMPVHNEAAYIERSLGSVLQQDYPACLMEVIVADGMSTDGTQETIQKLQAIHPNLHLIQNPKKFVPSGLNAAICQAKGDVIIRVDGHCEIAPDYVSRCVQHLQEEQVEGVGGPIETVGETFMAQAIAAAMSSSFGVGGSAFRTIKDRKILVDTVPFPAYPRRVIDQAGLYDEDLVRNQDDEYNYRIRKKGGKLLLSPDIRSRYYSRSSLASLWRQYFQYGFYKVRVLQKHPHQMSIRQFVPAVFVLALHGSAFLALFSPIGRLLLAFVVGTYLFADISVTISISKRCNWKHIFILPLVFPILHLSYGLGFLFGLARFSKHFSQSVPPKVISPTAQIKTPGGVDFLSRFKRKRNSMDGAIGHQIDTPLPVVQKTTVSSTILTFLDGVVRRTMDFCLALVGLIILSPLFLLLAILIKRDSPGPIFYRGWRAGRHNRNFQILKFRTMYEEHESYRGPKVTAQDDPRITLLGRWLRNTKVNELPQLINVLKGEMSLVGPRPEDPQIVAGWPEDVRQEILSARPGITSPASVVFRHEERMLFLKNVMDKYLWDILPSKLRLDQIYVRSRNILTDLDVIFWTFIVLLPSLDDFAVPTDQLVWGPLSRFMNRYVSWFMIDIFVSFVAVAITGIIWRLSGPLDLGVELAAGIALTIAFLFSLINSLMGVNRINWSRARPSDALDLAVSTAIVTVVLFVADLLWTPRMLLPPGMLLVSCTFSLLGFLLVRYRSRLVTGLATRWIYWRGVRATALGERVLIVGSGEVGQFAAWLLRNGSLASAFSITGVIDDDPRKSGMRIDGCQVLGNSQDIPALVEKYDIGLIMYAIANIEPAVQRQILSICYSTAARVVLVPNILAILKAHLPANEIEKDSLFSKVLRNTTVDEITGVYNRQHFMKLMETELPRAYRYGHPISLILFTVEYIKPPDAAYVPVIASQVMRSAAVTSNKVIREVDILGRYDDKTIALLLPETNLSGAYTVAERLRNILVGQPLSTESGPMKVCLRLGVASTEDEAMDAKTLIKKAQEAISVAAAA